MRRSWGAPLQRGQGALAAAARARHIDNSLAPREGGGVLIAA
jgi:hypothetical protein